MSVFISRSPDRALRIAIATDTFEPQTNGVSRTLGMATNALLARGHDVRVFTPEDPNAEPNPRIVGFKSRAFWAYPQLRMSRPMTREMVAGIDARWHPDLIHVATPFGVGLAALWTAQRLRIPLVSSYHTSLAACTPLYNLGVLSGTSAGSICAGSTTRRCARWCRRRRFATGVARTRL